MSAMSAPLGYGPAPDDKADQIRAELRAQMARRRISQTQLSAITGLPQSTISRRLNGDTPLDLEFLVKICDLLGMELALFSGPADPSNSANPRRWV